MGDVFVCKRMVLWLLIGLLAIAGLGAQAEEKFAAVVQLEDFSAYVPAETGIRFYGKLGANAPIKSVRATCWDMRRLETLGEYLWEAQEGEDVREIDLYSMRRSLFPEYRTGDFEIVIEVSDGNSTVEALRRRFFVAGDQSAPANLNELCEIEAKVKRDSYWTDGNHRTRWGNANTEDSIRIALPADKTACGIFVEWWDLPESASICAYDEAGELITETRMTQDTFNPINAFYSLPEGARTAEIKTTGSAAITELNVLEEGKVAPCVQQWEETHEKWDLMVISTHQDDEQIFYGGILPMYAQRDIDMGIVYMADCGHKRYTEALDGLWAVGMRNYPVFLGMRDGIIETKSGAYSYWGGEEPVLQALVEQIRRYKPEVILTHDFGGEYDNPQHMVTAECTAKAVEYAADPNVFPESAEMYGIWQPKKLYVHLYEENEIDFDWDQPMEGFGGMTGIEVSKMGYSYHLSQQQFVSYNLGLAHDNSRFGLYFTTVGPDTGKMDLMENIE